MSDSVHYVDIVLGLGAIVLQVLSLSAILLLIFKVKENRYLSLIKDNFLCIGFIISFFAVLTSLYFSEVLHYVPCLLCWYDRVFIFPQAVIFGVAWVKKDKNIFWAALILTLFGLVNSLYHIYVYYLVGEGAAPCDASGVSCVQRLVNEFGGYISIPTLAITGFVALLTVLLVAYFYKKNV